MDREPTIHGEMQLTWKVLGYLNSFSMWLREWESLGTLGLSKQTILLCLIQSAAIEHRFGWYRQLSGGNYFNSILQFIQAENDQNTLLGSNGI